MARDAHRAVDAVWRIESGRLIAGLARMVRDVGVAEDLAQDALLVALQRWPETGVPDNPGAWLMGTAKHRALDMFRQMGLPATTDLANDPFFGRPGLLMANGQRSQRLKFEILVTISDPDKLSACGSFNYHVDHFAEAYGIQGTDGEPAHTGCAGFGLERVALALLRHHGFAVEATRKVVQVNIDHWPGWTGSAEVRQLTG